MTGAEQLSALLLEQKRRKYPNVPDHAVPKPKVKINDSNSLTRAIIQTFEVHGLYCTRTQSQGQFDPRTKRFRKGTTKRGTADVHGIINGQHISVEVKYGQDRMSKAQRGTQQQVHASGGVYYIARDFEAFWNWFQQLKKG
ncbi:hypothetical protein GCM10027299_29080 [Larkinella ripae]